MVLLGHTKAEEVYLKYDRQRDNASVPWIRFVHLKAQNSEETEGQKHGL